MWPCSGFCLAALCMHMFECAQVEGRNLFYPYFFALLNGDGGWIRNCGGWFPDGGKKAKHPCLRHFGARLRSPDLNKTVAFQYGAPDLPRAVLELIT